MALYALSNLYGKSVEWLSGRGKSGDGAEGGLVRPSGFDGRPVEVLELASAAGSGADVYEETPVGSAVVPPRLAQGARHRSCPCERDRRERCVHGADAARRLLDAGGPGPQGAYGGTHLREAHGGGSCGQARVQERVGPLTGVQRQSRLRAVAYALRDGDHRRGPVVGADVLGGTGPSGPPIPPVPGSPAGRPS